MPTLRISKENGRFLVNVPNWPGSPPVGRGATMLEAIGAWLHNNQSAMCVTFEVAPEVAKTEQRRWARELRKR